VGPAGQLLVAGEQAAALAGGQQLGRLVAEGAELAEAAGPPVAPALAVGVGAVLDQGQRVAPGDLAEPVHVGHLVAQVDRHDRPGPGGDGRLDLVGVDGQGVTEDVAEHRQGPGGHGRVRRGREGQGGHDHLVAPADPQRLEGDLHGDGAVDHDHAVAGALVGGEPVGEGGGQRARLGEAAPAAAPDHLGDRLGVALVVHRPGRVALGPDRRPPAQRQLRHVVLPLPPG
jgi:hypothetical protein